MLRRLDVNRQSLDYEFGQIPFLRRVDFIISQRKQPPVERWLHFAHVCKLELASPFTFLLPVLYWAGAYLSSARGLLRHLLAHVFVRKASTRPYVVVGRLFSAPICRVAGSQRRRRSWGLLPYADRVFPEPCAVSALACGFRSFVFTVVVLLKRLPVGVAHRCSLFRVAAVGVGGGTFGYVHSPASRRARSMISATIA